MMRLTIALLLWGLVSSSLCAADPESGKSPPQKDRPNIVLIMVDDFGYECIAADGGESYRTPVIDRLAAEGMRFDNCHVQPLCTPTRVQLMTGRYNIRNYVQFGELLETETTFGQLLKQGGYRTGICGKWQLGQAPGLPQHFGFEESCLWQQTRRPPRYANPRLEYNGVEKDFEHGEYGPKLVNDFALDFIARHQQETFLLYYPMILTHNPFQPTPDSPDWDATTRGEKELQHPRHFGEMVAYTDRLVGRLLNKLDECGIRERTLVLFLGDNGTNKSITSRFRGEDYRGGKGQTNTRGTHVPFIANWPGVIPPGSVNENLISSADFLPTLCEVASVPIPSNVDGVSFLPQLRGQQGTPRKWLYTWYSPRQKKQLDVRECAFDREFKLYRTGELFDLQNDPFEEHPLDAENLSPAAQAATAKLQQVLDQFAQARPAELDRALDLPPEKQRPPRRRNASS